MTQDAAFQAHLCFEDFDEELKTEIQKAGGRILDHKERLFLSSPLEKKPTWSQCTWQNPEWVTIESINDAATQLKAKNNLWMNYSFQLHRRSELIQKKLLPRSPKPLQFMGSVPQKIFGAWTLWDEKLVLASPQTSSPLPLGLAAFEENKAIPSRAYLKLWELFTLHEAPPVAGARVLDLGSCPGGWSWVLCDLNCDVVSVDKAPLDEKLLRRPNIKVIKKDAFTLQPSDIGAVHTVFSDIICEPKRLYELAQAWLESGLCQRFVGSIKFKGKTDFAMLEKFCQIPESRVYHLCANKHELTWVCNTKESEQWRVVDLREEFSKTYDFVDSFSTLQGYSEDYIKQIIQMLAKNNISADFIFVESGPSGMMSYTQRQGTFELYVQRGETEVAVEAIRNFMETNKI